ncbi:hypothetical protein NECAME_05707 [Necator americanus]|uniref:Uncharacterized protein n=1 Tax=Necator americanus TaxID=51031 RepID=W2SH71_NECAM|nr:hypothetical protein NECAME_05707 [Necator americanus]ETN68226.1 hypothetical protein NECAME_05707 [Necator americanus]
MRGNVDEFEDALEYSEGFAENTINSTSYNRNRLQSVDASGCFVATSQADSETSFLPSYVSIPTQEFSASRRDRLNALRCRMREEFGAKDATFSSPTTVDWDSLSIASEGTSLHSWHRRVLAETQTIIVHPSDSMSTKAGLPFPSSLLFSDTRKTAGHHETDTSTWATMASLLSSGGLCNVSQNHSFSHRHLLVILKLFTFLHPTSTVHTTLLSTISSAGPPPNHPPPPLPPVESERYVGIPGIVFYAQFIEMKSLSQMNTDFRSPPPLPPRNRAVRLLGSVVAGSLSNSSEDKNRISSLTNDPMLLLARVVVNRKEIQTHKKTNSLDRGLTLAKSIKAGPFPPPSNKSNSLTHQETDDDGEECARNTEAEGVILQITTKIIGNDPLTFSFPTETAENELLNKGTLGVVMCDYKILIITTLFLP